MASPFNARNKLLTRTAVTALLSCGRSMWQLELLPKDLSEYQRAFVHKSFCSDTHPTHQHPPEGGVPLQPESNVKLEWLGDSVLQLIVTELLLERHTETADGVCGVLTEKRQGLVNNRTLAAIGKDLGLDEYLLVDSNLEAMGGRSNGALLADCFEAFVGAVYTDLGHAVCRRWLKAVLGDRLGPAAPRQGGGQHAEAQDTLPLVLAVVLAGLLGLGGLLSSSSGTRR